MRDPTEAHFLHHQDGLDPVMSPPLDGVKGLGWLPRKTELLVATGDGELVSVDPIMGTRTVLDGLGEVGAMRISPDGKQVAVIVRGRALVVWDLAAKQIVARTPIELLADLWVDFWSGGVAATGQGLDGHRIIVVGRQGEIKAQGPLPKGFVVGVNRKGQLLQARVTNQGAEAVPLGTRLPRRKVTGHRLRLDPTGMLYGVAEGGVTIWPGPNKPPRTVRAYHVTSAALSPDGKLVAMGMRDGGVALTEVFADAPTRGHPGRSGGHEVAVRALAFSERGGWLASAADRCWLWRWS